MRETSKRVEDDVQDPACDEAGVRELAQAADRLFYAMRRSRAATVGRSGAGLSMAQLTLLEPLSADTRGDGLPVGKLAATAEVSVPTATRMLKQLEAAGAVTRQRAPHDERQVLVRLTDDGADRLAAMRTELRARQSEALSHFTPRERRELAAQLQRLAAVIGDTVPQPGDGETTRP
ncbi:MULTISPECIES: MarR family winged helix-turn-helix transcriptional regulator [unclassified Streptomyces]|uniref:MarR family winged helix-turn-helix transcriptional regulator n=1 Tax=unclassified Streptomyces TaxID=2593676 RepID=UPI0007DD9997|nr:MarR family transcriptional regulator [Streptomyces sp. SAT1]ANH89715.1 MarR family transcriptional regulator [Streptomyces sp. SAT1]